MQLRLVVASLITLAGCGAVDATLPDAGSGGGDAPVTGRLAVTVGGPGFVRTGGELVVDVTVERRDLEGPVAITLAPLAGVTADALELPAGVDAGQLVVRAATTAPFARASLDVTATSGDAVAHTLLALEIIGAPADVDPTFGTGGATTFAAAPGELEIPVFALAQGERIVVGIAVVRDGKPGVVLVRRDRLGAADPTFGIAGEVFLDPAAFGLTSMQLHAIVQPDGRLLLAGSGSNGNDQDPFVMRLGADGQPDATLPFKRIDTSSTSLTVAAVAVGPTGEIVLGGAKELAAGSDAILIRLDTSGTRDAGFGSSGIATFNELAFDGAAGIVIQPDGRIVALISTSNGFQLEFPQFALRRFATDGKLDATYGQSGKATLPTPEGFASATVVASRDGLNVVVGGTVRTTFGGGDRAVWRFLADGRLDLEFGGGLGYHAAPATANFDGVSTMTIADDDTIYAVGTEVESFVTIVNFNLLHLDASGTPDPAFGVDGVRRHALLAAPSASVLRADHRLLVVTMPGIPDAATDTTIRSFWR